MPRVVPSKIDGPHCGVMKGCVGEAAAIVVPSKIDGPHCGPVSGSGTPIELTVVPSKIDGPHCGNGFQRTDATVQKLSRRRSTGPIAA